MKFNSNFLDRFVFEGDKSSPDTFQKGKFFITIQSLFFLLNTFSLPYYFTTVSIALPFSIKLLYVVTCLVLGASIYIYPKYGHRIALVNLHSLLGSSVSMYSTFHFSGGIYSPDLTFSPAITIYTFLVANRITGIIWTAIGTAQVCYFYSAALEKGSGFMEVAFKLGPEYYLYSILFAVGFAVMVILLYENMMNALLKIIRKSHKELELKNKEVTDSINYARRIQLAKLPKIEELLEYFPQSFILYQPKDIISGDFYFLQKKDNLYFVAAADCTGHGVPGALMSMISSERLNESLNRHNNVHEILSDVNVGIKNALQQSDHTLSASDGMDIALCSLDLTNGQLNFAGANRPLWIIRKGAKIIEETKPTKKGIGGSTDNQQNFDKHSIQLNVGDTFYIYTDGYVDQFGGPEQKKLKSKNFKEILLSIQNKTMSEQQAFLHQYFETWKGNSEQVDDILLIGVRL